MQENKRLYGEEVKPRVIGYGSYKGVKWAITSVKGTHPCAYIEDKLEGRYEELYEIPLYVHGGVTFRDYCHFNPEEANVKYIGWDYAHLGDYLDYHYMPEKIRLKFKDDKKWTYDEIKEEIFKAIDDMLMLKEDKSE